MKRRLVVLAVLSVLLAGALSPTVVSEVRAASPDSHAAVVHTHSPAAAFDKTRFVAHLAVSAFLIHYIYKKYQEHKLGRLHIFTDLKAAAAALLAYHELKVAYGIAKSSKSKTLQALVAPIGAVSSAASTLASKLKTGNTSEISPANNLVGTLSSVASKNGFGFKDQQPSGFGGF